MATTFHDSSEMDKSNGYNENTFTFRVGASRKPFVVHADIMSRHSKVLSRLIEGPFKESIEKAAELPEVEPEIFGYFLAYAYFMTNAPSVKETITRPPSALRTPISKVIELLLVNGQKQFKCKICSSRPELKFSLYFPLCDSCGQGGLRTVDWSSQCIVSDCSESGGCLLGLLCTKCMQTLGVLHPSCFLRAEGARRLQLELTPRLEELQSFHFDIPLRVKDILEAQEGFHTTTYPTSAIFSATLLETVRLATFADIYGIEPFSQVALMSLYQKLTQEPLDEKSITSVCEVTELVYSSTIVPATDSTSGDSHVLRRMLSEFIATHRGKFLASPTFMELLRQGGELSGDILSFTV